MSLLNNYTLSSGTTSYYALASAVSPLPGPTGPQGPIGETGPQGANGNSILSDVNPPDPGLGQIGDLYVDLATTQLYKKTGLTTWTPQFPLEGPAGAAATIAVGLTTTGAPGTTANVSNTGTSSAAVFNFNIPRGDTGPTGPSGSAADAALWSQFPATQTVDMCGNDLNGVGSLTTAGLATVDFGSVIPPSAPLVRFTVLSSEVAINHLDPLSQMVVRGQGDVRIESTQGDLNLIGDDVNIATTGSTNVLNISSVSIIQNTAGGAINNTAGGAFAVQAGGLISLLTTGSIQIGSGNIFGATTSIEKLDIVDSEVSKISGAADLTFKNTALIQNSGNSLNKMRVEAIDANTEVVGRGIILRTTGDPTGETTGDIQLQIGTTPYVVLSQTTGITTFSNTAPQTAIAPVSGADLTNKTYVDTKLPANADIDLTNNLAASAASAATNGPFLYVPAALGPPTGTPTAISGAVPLYMDISGGVKLYTFAGGIWNPI
jgi:hypothetical protein